MNIYIINGGQLLFGTGFQYFTVIFTKFSEKNGEENLRILTINFSTKLI